MSGKLRLAIIGTVISIVFGLSACTPDNEAKQMPVTIIDQLGRTVQLDKMPERIISLAPSNTEILFALGLGPKIVGVTDYCNYPPEATEKEKVGGFSTPDIEKIVALNPDLIVAASNHEKKIIPELERRNLPVVALAPKTLADITDAITLMGTLSGHTAEAKRIITDMQSRIDRIRALTGELPPEQIRRVFFMVWHDPLRTVGQDIMHNELIELAGGKNIFDDTTGYPSASFEVVLERNPEVILANTGHGSGGDSPFQWATNEPRLKGTAAAKESRIYEIDADIVNRAGPRIVQALETMLQLIHPELYEKL